MEAGGAGCEGFGAVCCAREGSAGVEWWGVGERCGGRRGVLVVRERAGGGPVGGYNCREVELRPAQERVSGREADKRRIEERGRC